MPLRRVVGFNASIGTAGALARSVEATIIRVVSSLGNLSELLA